MLTPGPWNHGRLQSATGRITRRISVSRPQGARRVWDLDHGRPGDGIEQLSERSYRPIVPPALAFAELRARSNIPPHAANNETNATRLIAPR